jgi:transcription elongation factor GreB
VAQIDKPTPQLPNYITPEGHERLRAEHGNLVKRERPRVVNEVAEAAAQGDRSENAEYIYGKKRLREIDRRVRFLEQRLDAAQIVDPRQQTRRERVFFGATVTVEDEDGVARTWTIVGEDETDAQAAKISHRSPIGQALLGKALDDEIKVRTPGGERLYAIVGIGYP